MNKPTNYLFFLKVILWLIAIHSLIIGILLILMPTDLFHIFGFEIENKFFPCQGGAFHIVMAVAYVLAAKWFEKSDSLVVFSFIAKFIATIFLILYYLIGERIFIILISGIADFLMGLLIIIPYWKYKKINLHEKDY